MSEIQTYTINVSADIAEVKAHNYDNATITAHEAQNATDDFLDPAVRLLLAMIDTELIENMNL